MSPWYIDSSLMGIIKREYMRNPYYFAYLLYDIAYYPEYTEFTVRLSGNDVVGYILYWNGGLGEAALHIYGDVNSDETYLKYLETDSKLIVWVTSNKQGIVERIVDALSKRGLVKTADYLTMVTDHGMFKGFSHTFNVRRLGLGDIAQLSSLMAERGSSVSIVELAARLTSPHWHYYGAFVNGELAAIATTYLKLPEVWVVGDVYTRPRFRGLGLAKAVTSAVTRDALACGASAMLHVDWDNEPAVRAYRRIGYRALYVSRWVMYSP